MFLPTLPLSTVDLSLSPGLNDILAKLILETPKVWLTILLKWYRVGGNFVHFNLKKLKEYPGTRPCGPHFLVNLIKMPVPRRVFLLWCEEVLQVRHAKLCLGRCAIRFSHSDSLEETYISEWFSVHFDFLIYWVMLSNTTETKRTNSMNEL